MGGPYCRIMQGDSISGPEQVEGSFVDSDHVRTHYTRWRPRQERAVVQLAHGVGEHVGRYEHVAAALAAAGYDVWADDHHGHGRTGVEQHGGDLRRLGTLGRPGVRGAVRSMHEFTRVIRDAQPDLPLVLLAHSWGSLMAQIIMNQHAADYDAVVLTGTAHRTVGHMNGGKLNARYDGPGATGLEWLSRDPAVARAFLDDPLTTDKPLLKLFGPLNTIRLLGRPAKDLAGRKDLPILIAVGEQDPLGGGTSVGFLAADYRTRSGFSSVTTVVYPGARHEILNETNRDDVLAEIIAWMDKAAFAKPGQAAAPLPYRPDDGRT
ncbi:MAG: alpha/beta hydrolase [Propionicimonas sp.]